MRDTGAESCLGGRRDGEDDGVRPWEDQAHRGGGGAGAGELGSDGCGGRSGVQRGGVQGALGAQGERGARVRT